MGASTSIVIYLLFYVITIIYFVVLSCIMFTRRGNDLSTRGEQEAKLRMTRTMGVAMAVWALGWFVYLPPLLSGCQSGHPVYKVLFLVVLMMGTPVVYHVMFAVSQRKVSILGWTCALGVPFLLLALWQGFCPPRVFLPAYIGAALSVASYLSLLVRFASEYRHYVRRLRSEYSETASREIVWSWFCFSGLAVLGIVFVVFHLFWTPMVEVLYLLFTIVNVTYLCFCICRQRPIDLEVVPETEPAVEIEDKREEKALYASIEQKLQSQCEQKLLFLDPDLTRETLALRLGINRTYLGMYFRKHDLTFYHYINALRMEYAYRLMQDNPHLSIRKVAEQSGFRSQTTFRKVFQEVMGCLPSEVKRPTTIS